MKKIYVIIATLALSTNLFAQQWLTMAPMPTPRHASGSAVMNNIIYVIGGANNSGTTLNVVEAYDPTTNTWTTKTPMPTARTGLGVATVNGEIYAIGGYSIFGTSLGTVEEYDPSTNSWSTKASMPTPRSNLSVGVVNKQIYAVGGWQYGLTNLEMYDPSTNTWTKEAPLSVGLMSINSGATVNNGFYFIGGKHETSSATTVVQTNQYYDPSTNTWTDKANLPAALFNGAVTVLNGQIHYFGGAYQTVWNVLPPTDIFADHYIYDPSADSWQTGVPIPHRCYNEVAETVNGNMYVIGGMDSTNHVVNWNEEYGTAFATQVSTPKNNNLLKVYPNPAKYFVNINIGNYSAADNYTLRIENTLGQIVYTKSINQPALQINTNNIGSGGVYFVQILDNSSDVIAINKLIIQ